jgi:hypothetical protein
VEFVIYYAVAIAIVIGDDIALFGCALRYRTDGEHQNGSGEYRQSHRSNENKMSDGGRGRASLGLEV